MAISRDSFKMLSNMCLSLGPIKYVKNGPSAMFWSKELHRHGGSILASGRFDEYLKFENTHTDPKLGEMYFLSPITLQFRAFIHWIVLDLFFSLRDMRLHFVVGCLLNLLFYVICRSHTPQHHNRAHFRVAFEASLSKWGLVRSWNDFNLHIKKFHLHIHQDSLWEKG